MSQEAGRRAPRGQNAQMVCWPIVLKYPDCRRTALCIYGHPRTGFPFTRPVTFVNLDDLTLRHKHEASRPMAQEPQDDLRPREPIHLLTEPVQRFLHVEAASGVLLLICTAVAMILANSPAGDWYVAIWKTKVGFAFGGFSMMYSLKHWINDGLMAIFFFVVGLEVKREMVHGRAARPQAGRPARRRGHRRHGGAGRRSTCPAGRHAWRPAAGAFPWPRTSPSWSAAWPCSAPGAAHHAGDAAFAGHRRRHRRHPGHRHRLHRIAEPDARWCWPSPAWPWSTRWAGWACAASAST